MIMPVQTTFLQSIGTVLSKYFCKCMLTWNRSVLINWPKILHYGAHEALPVSKHDPNLHKTTQKPKHIRMSNKLTSTAQELCTGKWRISQKELDKIKPLHFISWQHAHWQQKYSFSRVVLETTQRWWRKHSDLSLQQFSYS